MQEQSRCKGLKERIGFKTLTELTPASLATYRENRLSEVGPKTFREELSLLQRVFNVCLKDWMATHLEACSRTPDHHSPRGYEVGSSHDPPAAHLHQ